MNSTNNATKPNYFSIIFLIVVLVFCGYKYVWSKVNTSWVVDAACTEVKSLVYSDYGEVPSVSGSILYQNVQDYIVVVSYSLGEFDWDGNTQTVTINSGSASNSAFAIPYCPGDFSKIRKKFSKNYVAGTGLQYS